jgi:hypothetical protein
MLATLASIALVQRTDSLVLHQYEIHPYLSVMLLLQQYCNAPAEILRSIACRMVQLPAELQSSRSIDLITEQLQNSRPYNMFATFQHLDRVMPLQAYVMHDDTWP